MATISNNNIAQAIYLATQDKSPSEQRAVFGRFVQFLNRKHLLNKSEAILSALGQIINKEEGRVEVKVTSAKSLKPTEKDHIVQSLKKRYSAKVIHVDENIDKSLLGGIKLEAGDEVIDFSIKNKIHQLQEHLTKEI